MSKPRRKYNPHRQAVKLSKTFAKKFAIVWAGTLEAQVVNLNTGKLAQLARSEGAAITEVPHQWTAYLCVMLRDHTGREYLQYETLVCKGEYKSCEVSDLVTDQLNEVYKTCNPNHRVNVGWVATASRDEIGPEQLTGMMTNVGAWEFLAKWESTE